MTIARMIHVAGWVVLASCVPEFGQRERQARLELGHIRSALNEYRKRTGRFPGSLADIAPPTCRKNCTLVELHADPWGSPYAFASDGTSGIIRSAGPNRLGHRPLRPYGSDPLRAPA